jgi:hypothetical protein
VIVSTPDLIRSLADQLAPVTPLRPPWLRSLIWLAMAAAVVAIVAVYHGLRPDLATKLRDPAFLVQVAAALMTGLTAAVAAFHLSLPDRSDAWLYLPLPSLGLWLSGIGYGCLTNWIALTGTGSTPGESGRCLATIVLTSLPLSLLMLIMLRHAGPIRPVTTAGLGGLAVAAFAASALSLLHGVDASLEVLIWNFGTVALFVPLGGVAGCRLFSFVGLARL